jgi:hypothetical protein
MPVHIIENENPQIPAWGSIALEVYFLSEWDKSHPDPSQEFPADRRQRLLRQFLALGYEGRLVNKSHNPSKKSHNIELTKYQPISLTSQAIHHPLLLKPK